jgi:mono/diheme cytochrome c family protein
MLRALVASCLPLALIIAACGGTTPPADPVTAAADSATPPATSAAPVEAPVPVLTATPSASASATATSASTAPTTTPDASPRTPAQLVAAADGTRGAKLYDEMKCKGCHGTAAKPSTKFPKLFGLGWDDEGLERAFRVIKKGESPMPGFEGKLDDAQIADVVRFLQDG